MKISSFFENDHKEIDGFLNGFQATLSSGKPDSVLFRNGAARLRNHIYWEEEILFPKAEKSGIRGPTEVMRVEHGEIWNVLSNMELILDSMTGTTQIQKLLSELTQLLKDHNIKEEQMLYPMCDQLIPPETSEGILKKTHTEKMPRDWVCVTLR